MVTGSARPDAPVNHVFPAWDVITGSDRGYRNPRGDASPRIATGEGEHITLALSDIGYATVGQSRTHRRSGGERHRTCIDRQRSIRCLRPRFRDEGRSQGDDCGNHRPPVEEVWSTPSTATRRCATWRRCSGVDLSDEGQRFEARDVVAPVVARWVGARGYDEVSAAIFDDAGVCWGPYQSFLEMVRDDPRCSTEQSVVRGSRPARNRPLHDAGLAAGVPAPRAGSDPTLPLTLGQHTDEILADVLGLSGARIGELREQPESSPERGKLEGVRSPVASRRIDTAGLPGRDDGRISVRLRNCRPQSTDRKRPVACSRESTFTFSPSSVRAPSN